MTREEIEETVNKIRVEYDKAVARADRYDWLSSVRKVAVSWKKMTRGDDDPFMVKLVKLIDDELDGMK